jgi:hypothetical protein
VRPADFRRRYDARCNPIAQALKVADDIVEAEGQMAGDVFKEGPFGADLSDDTCNIGPEVAGIVLAFAVAREGEGLARITGSDDMNAAAPWSAVKGSEIVPDRSRSHGRVCHPCHENGRRETVSLDMTYSPISGFSEAKAEIQSSDTGAKTDSAKVVMSDGGMKSHKGGPFQRDRRSLWV